MALATSIKLLRFFTLTDIFRLSLSFHKLFAFFCFKIGPEVVLAARWRPRANMTSLFDSPTPILYRLSVEIFRLCLTVQQLFECIYLAGNLASGFHNLGFSGGLNPKSDFVSTRLPKGTSVQQTASFESSCVQIG
jgi:hypothetical protein